jgi:hypothetical protein
MINNLKTLKRRIKMETLKEEIAKYYDISPAKVDEICRKASKCENCPFCSKCFSGLNDSRH